MANIIKRGSKRQLIKSLIAEIENQPAPVAAALTIPEIASPNIKVASGTVPVILTAVRTVVTVNLGVLQNKTRAVIGFFPAAVSDNDIKYFKQRPTTKNGFGGLNVQPEGNADFCFANLAETVYPCFNLTNMFNLLLVTENYLKATRSCAPLTESINASTDFHVDWNGKLTYEGINKNVLVGWYTSAGTGPLGLSNKTQLESAWLTQSGSDTVLNMAFKNVAASGSNLALNFKVAVYE